MSNYVYLVKSKKGEPKDLWIMNAPDPKQATHIFSARFARYVKPVVYDDICGCWRARNESL